MSRNKIGRNQKCTCGSGKKYKRCHGSITRIPPQLEQEINLHEQRHLASQAIIQKQQGHGKNIIAVKHKNHQLVVVGKKVFYSDKWETFHDFLFEYIIHILGSEWFNNEISKPPSERHIIVKWNTEINEYKRQFVTQGKISSAPMTGVMEAYLRLAYNLYLLAHNVELQTRLINRLKEPRQFPGAYYEAIVFGNIIKSGFLVEFEDESGNKGKRCECVILNKESNNKFTIEAKLIHRYKSLGVTKNTTSKTLKKSIGHQLKNALGKISDHPRIIFIELNLRDDVQNKLPSWVDEIYAAIKEKEKVLISSPPAYIFITNHPYHYHIKDTSYMFAAMGIGFKIPDFGHGTSFKSLKEQYDSKKRHHDVYLIGESLIKHYEIPSTFDGSIPELKYSRGNNSRLLIGEKYLIPDQENEVVGTLQTATVDVTNKLAIGVYSTDDKRSLMVSTPLSEAEIVAYEKYPDEFFGVFLEQGKKLEDNDHVGLFEFFLKSFKNTPKEKLLELMNNHPDIKKMTSLSQEDLAVIYSERMVHAFLAKK